MGKVTDVVDAGSKTEPVRIGDLVIYNVVDDSDRVTGAGFVSTRVTGAGIVVRLDTDTNLPYTVVNKNTGTYYLKRDEITIIGSLEERDSELVRMVEKLAELSTKYEWLLLNISDQDEPVENEIVVFLSALEECIKLNCELISSVYVSTRVQK